MLPSFLLAFALCAGAQEKEERVYEFLFVPRNDIFFVPYVDNRSELEQLSSFVAEHKEAIEKGRMPLYVDGYCNSLPDEARNLSIARTRANRVKSELIVRQGLTEKCFVTHTHAGKGNRVTVWVRIAAPHDTTTVAAIAENEKAGKAVTETETPLKEAREMTVTDAGNVNRVVENRLIVEENEPAVREDAGKSGYPFAIRTNLLRWATLTPDLGLEWRVSHRMGILVHGSWTSWSWDNRNRRYALWEISPELRYYIGKEKRGYLGAMYHFGEFNYKFGGTGKEGDYQGGGITGGYMLQLNRMLSLDFHAGIGYTRAEYDKYKVTDGVRVRRGTENKNYWGVNRLGVTLVWKFNH